MGRGCSVDGVKEDGTREGQALAAMKLYEGQEVAKIGLDPGS